MSSKPTITDKKGKRDRKSLGPMLKLSKFPNIVRKLFNQTLWNTVDEREFFSELNNNYGYFIRSKIGEGAYSKVYYAEKLSQKETTTSKTKVACKIIDRRLASDAFCNRFLPREIKLIKLVNHPNIIQVFNIAEMGPFLSICMEFSEFGDLLHHIQLEAPFTESRSKLYFSQLASAVEYLHSINIAHRDIKCENVMVTGIYTIKLSDFGFGRKIRHIHGKTCLSKTFCGSTEYAPPEVLRGIPYNLKLFDIWSMGCLLYIMAYGLMLFGGESNVIETVKHQEAHSIHFPSPKKDQLEHLLCQMLHPNVEKRYSIEKVLEHDWLRKTDSAEPSPSQTLTLM